MTSDSEFNTIRPYCDSEIEAAIERLCKSEEFLTLFTHLTKMDRATIQGALQGIRSRAEFQAKFFGPISDQYDYRRNYSIRNGIGRQKYFLYFYVQSSGYHSRFGHPECTFASTW